MNYDNSTFQNAKNVFSSLLPPPPTLTRVSRVLTKNKKHGWTLAETLITLTIIGVIAALTLPNLMSNFRKREIETALPIAYKIIDDAMKLAVITNGHPSTWTYDGGIGFAEKYFMPFVKVSKNCGAGTGADVVKDTGCFKSVKRDNNNPNLTYTYSGIWYELNGTPCGGGGGYTSAWYHKMILANGMHFAVWATAAANSAQALNNGIWFMVDVNGAKGPTKVGVDVFAFHLNQRTGKILPGHREKPKNDNNGCDLTKAGYDCTIFIQQNGWKFPDDYPVKKW